VTMGLKQVISSELQRRGKWLAPDQQEALDMICHKIGRIVNGDPDYDDSWRDIAGYAQLVCDRLVRDDDDEPQQHCLEAIDPPEANSKPTPNDRQIRSSLVKRVHSCIVGEPECGHMQARAVIREVAAWLREQEAGQ